MTVKQRLHGCIESADEQLGKRNTRLSRASTWPVSGGAPDERLVIATEKVDSRKRGTPVKMFANFCPFCGAHLR